MLFVMWSTTSTRRVAHEFLRSPTLLGEQEVFLPGIIPKRGCAITRCDGDDQEMMGIVGHVGDRATLRVTSSAAITSLDSGIGVLAGCCR